MSCRSLSMIDLHDTSSLSGEEQGGQGSPGAAVNAAMAAAEATTVSALLQPPVTSHQSMSDAPASGAVYSGFSSDSSSSDTDAPGFGAALPHGFRLPACPDPLQPVRHPGPAPQPSMTGQVKVAGPAVATVCCLRCLAQAYLLSSPVLLIMLLHLLGTRPCSLLLCMQLQLLDAMAWRLL